MTPLITIAIAIPVISIVGLLYWLYRRYRVRLAAAAKKPKDPPK